MAGSLISFKKLGNLEASLYEVSNISDTQAVDYLEHRELMWKMQLVLLTC